MDLRFCRILMALLSLGSTRGIDKNGCTCTEPETLASAADGEVPVDVPCPKVSADEMKFNLLKGEAQMVTHLHNSSRNQTVLQPGIEIYFNNAFAHFKLTGSKAREPGLYSCQVVATFPPPIRYYHNETRVRVLMGELRGNIESHAEPYTMVWILCLSALGLYSLVVTMVIFISLVKRRCAESSQGDYINAPRRHNKGGGVMIPVARYF